MTLSTQVGGSGCPQRASIKRTPFWKVFRVWSPYRIELKNLASLVATAGLLTVELDADIERLEAMVGENGEAVTTASAKQVELEETIG